MLALAHIRSNAVKLSTIFLLVLSAQICAQAQCTFTNGDFETANLTGWTTYLRAQNPPTSGPTGWLNYAGTSTPSLHTISAPPQGTRGALSDQNGATTAELYQDFTLPAGQSGTLTFYLAYNNYNTSFITLPTLDWLSNQQVRVDLIKTTTANESIAANDVYAKLFQTQPGDPFVLTPTQMTYDVSGFAGQPTRLRFASAIGVYYFEWAVDNVCLSTTRTTITRPTAVASNAKADFGDVSLQFPTVTAAGTTSLQQLDPAAQTGPPAGLTFIGPAYDISTTATHTNPVHVCFILPGITDATTFSHLRMLHKEGGVWVNLASSLQNFNTKQLCGNVTSLSPFAVGSGSGPTSAAAQISGHITTPDGAPLGGVVMQLDGSENKRTITDADGFYSFAIAAGGLVTVTADRGNYSFTPRQRSITPTGNVTDATFTALPDAVPTVNPLDADLFFVRQQYLDFLGREPDAGGLDYWAGELGRCGADQACLRQRRVDISAAFFASAEFQQTGSFVYRLYSAGLGRRLTQAEFAADRQQVVGGANLSESKSALASRFVEREEFLQRYASNSTAESFVDAVLATVRNAADVDMSAQRGDLINRYQTGAGVTESRSLVLSDVIEGTDFKQAAYNPSFVLMEYFGYLGRNPDEGGYVFWLNVLDNRDPGNVQGMVCSFLTSAEYQQRFAPVITHANGECGK